MKKLNALALLFYTVNAFSQSFIPVKIAIKEGHRIFLNLESRNVIEKNQDGWDFAVIDERHEIGAKINDSKGIRLWKIYKDTAFFGSINLSDTSDRTINSTAYLYLGAFDTTYTDKTNSVLNPYYQLGLGKLYNTIDNPYFCFGDKCYIIQRADGEYGKMYLSSYKNINNERIYTFRYSKIDGTQDAYFQVKKSTIFTKHHSYVNLTDKSYNTNFELDNANSWDLVFSSYEKWSGSQVVKKPIGVFINNGVLNISFSEIPGRPSTYDIPKIYTQSYDTIGDPSLLTYDKRFEGFKLVSKKQDQILTKWMDASDNLISNNNFFIKNNAGAIFHVYFSGLDKVNNTVDINIKRISSALEDAVKSASYKIENNSDLLKISTDAIEEKNFVVTAYDLMGRTIASSETKNGELILDKSLWNTSVVILQVKNDQSIINYKIASLN
jgi:hypothetical protein